MKKTIRIYCDGSCLRNPGGAGGWAAILLYAGYCRELFGNEKDTTNNRMELMAVIKALSALKRDDVPVEVFTDSKYVRNGITEWVFRWKKNGWRTSAGGDVKNRDLWERLNKLCKRLHPTFNWVPGHSGIPENERADYLAGEAARSLASGMPGGLKGGGLL